MRLFIFLLAYVVVLSGFLLLNGVNSSEPLSISRAVAVPDGSNNVLALTTESYPLLLEINRKRISIGLEPVQFNTIIESVTRTRSREMSRDFQYSHTRNDGSDYSALFANSPYSFSCENLQLQDNSSIDTAVTSWLQSDSHRSCLLHKDIAKAAVSIERFGNDQNMELYVFVFIAASE